MRRLADSGRAARIEAAFATPEAVAAGLGDDPDIPTAISSWLGRLHALMGVPFGYLVPDEAMLPPESIRFFRLDDNWMRALIDGAYSIGRNLTTDAGSPGMNVDRVMFDGLVDGARAAAPLRRRTLAEAAAPGSAGDRGDPQPWTGFLLRSRILTEYPGLGVNVYPQDGVPKPGRTPILLPVRRLDRLGPDADTLLCLVEGDAFRVDVHEAPELLHYGIDSYTPATPDAPPSATKKFRTFTRTTQGAVTLADHSISVPIGSAFRTRSPRVVNVGQLAVLLQAQNGPDAERLDSAKMGFAMTQGVGMVSFERKDA